ncbi:MAG TPA: UDP-N-acetylmuramoylalanyl-D-glutamyl-2,6-diaminopimelate--D-alanyl-D-alanine ligase [Dongiaceae bacterium]|nr:UDP-N-acetylmuramoylalanyl-D-glutamyl-2,6-diaminopimelate--D-alanyl-D-alanine ligase [Dongiaceae bacterium]
MSHGRALWTSAEIAAAVNGRAGKRFAADGVSIDSRKVERGDLFVALHGPNFDGNDFVAAALGAGAAGALVDRLPANMAADMPVVVVKDTLEALQALGAAARARSAARIAAVTGSVGKTSTKEALKAALGAFGRTFASQGNLNNHWGAPLSLARMPRDAEFGVFELGMNHAGEISPLSKLVRPAVAIITNVEAVHIEFFASVAAIADAKAEIMDGMDAHGSQGATVVLPRDNPHYERLAAHARRRGVAILSFGADDRADARLIDCQVSPQGSRVVAEVMGEKVSYGLGLPGLHQAKNSLSVLAAVAAFGLDVAQGASALADLKALKGRGARERLHLPGGAVTLLDESYNASPASVRAALSLLRAAEPEGRGRRIAILGDMRELGEQGPGLHRALAPDLAAAGVELAFLIGPLMRGLHDLLPESMRGGHWGDSQSAVEPIRAALRGGDVVLVKGSLGTRMAPIVEALRAADAETMRRPKAANGD